MNGAIIAYINRNIESLEETKEKIRRRKCEALVTLISLFSLIKSTYFISCNGEELLSENVNSPYLSLSLPELLKTSTELVSRGMESHSELMNMVDRCILKLLGECEPLPVAADNNDRWKNAIRSFMQNAKNMLGMLPDMEMEEVGKLNIEIEALLGCLDKLCLQIYLASKKMYELLAAINSLDLDLDSKIRALRRLSNGSNLYTAENLWYLAQICQGAFNLKIRSESTSEDFKKFLRIINSESKDVFSHFQQQEGYEGVIPCFYKIHDMSADIWKKYVSSIVGMNHELAGVESEAELAVTFMERILRLGDDGIVARLIDMKKNLVGSHVPATETFNLRVGLLNRHIHDIVERVTDLLDSSLFAWL